MVKSAFLSQILVPLSIGPRNMSYFIFLGRFSSKRNRIDSKLERLSLSNEIVFAKHLKQCLGT